MLPWSHAPTPFQRHETVYSGTSRGTVVAVDEEQATVGIVWEDGDGGVIVYPIDAAYIRKAMP